MTDKQFDILLRALFQVAYAAETHTGRLDQIKDIFDGFRREAKEAANDHR